MFLGLFSWCVLSDDCDHISLYARTLPKTDSKSKNDKSGHVIMLKQNCILWKESLSSNRRLTKTILLVCTSKIRKVWHPYWRYSPKSMKCFEILLCVYCARPIFALQIYLCPVSVLHCFYVGFEHFINISVVKVFILLWIFKTTGNNLIILFSRLFSSEIDNIL